jgi:hypothetical protein
MRKGSYELRLNNENDKISQANSLMKQLEQKE